jgi:hypothetical protein
MTLKVEIETIPHDLQRYNTVGDWQVSYLEPLFHINVSELRDWRMEAAIAIHELVECALCHYMGISQAQVDTFDQTYEGQGEPGDDRSAPYQVPHALATGVERTVLAMLGVNWTDYQERIDECQNRDSTSSASKGMAPDSQCG